jgi:hypothetical protein
MGYMALLLSYICRCVRLIESVAWRHPPWEHYYAQGTKKTLNKEKGGLKLGGQHTTA